MTLVAQRRQLLWLYAFVQLMIHSVTLQCSNSQAEQQIPPAVFMYGTSNRVYWLPTVMPSSRPHARPLAMSLTATRHKTAAQVVAETMSRALKPEVDEAVLAASHKLAQAPAPQEELHLAGATD